MSSLGSNLEALQNYLSEKKIDNIQCFSADEKIDYCDYIIICSANSHTHANAVSQSMIEEFKKNQNIEPLNQVRKHHQKDWVLVDYGDIIIHIFYGENREKYKLEEMYSHLELLEID